MGGVKARAGYICDISGGSCLCFKAYKFSFGLYP